MVNDNDIQLLCASIGKLMRTGVNKEGEEANSNAVFGTQVKLDTARLIYTLMETYCHYRSHKPHESETA